MIEQSSTLDIFEIVFFLDSILFYLNYPLVIIFGIIIVVKRYKLNTNPFVIIVWIYPIIHIINLVLTIISSSATFFWSSILFGLIGAIFPALIITVLAKKFSKKSLKGQTSIRAPRAIMPFPVDRELIFISYATADSGFFQIPRITKVLTSYPEIDEILYWESDMHDDIYRYMDINLKRCKVVLLFCSKNSLYSEAVNMEWSSALKLNKRIIPIFINPDDIPALLTTKLGVQFKQSDPYSTIEDIYRMILKKLEIESVRDFTKYLIPKWITVKDFDTLHFETTEDSIVFDSDIPSSKLGILIASILQANNFYVPDLESMQKSKKSKKKKTLNIGNELNQFMCFAELKDDPEEIAISVKIQSVTESNNKVFITIRGKREWVLKEILNDIDSKLIEIKSKTELIRNYSGMIISLFEWIGDMEKFLRKFLGSNVKLIEEIIDQFKNGEINEEEFIIKGTQSLGKEFITVFIKNKPYILKEKKKILDKKPTSQTPNTF